MNVCVFGPDVALNEPHGMACRYTYIFSECQCTVVVQCQLAADIHAQILDASKVPTGLSI